VATLKAYEQDFLKAYKGHMDKVKAELKFLKNKQNDLVGKLMGDDEITNLQASIKWFKQSAVKLNRILDQQRNSIKGGQELAVAKQSD
jgi:hypothetical protein